MTDLMDNLTKDCVSPRDPFTLACRLTMQKDLTVRRAIALLPDERLTLDIYSVETLTARDGSECDFEGNRKKVYGYLDLMVVST